MIDRGSHGSVRIIEGAHVGIVGYYDSDEFVTCKDLGEMGLPVPEGAGPRKKVELAIVYLGVPFESEWTLLPYSWLEVYRSEELVKWIAEHRDEAQILGVEERAK